MEKPSPLLFSLHHATSLFLELHNNYLLYQGFFKEDIRYPVEICRDLVSLILGTR